MWSPRGDLIAFTKITEGAFHIGVMHPDGSGERILTHRLGRRRSDLGAQWPGHHVHAHDTNGRGRLWRRFKVWSVDVTGRNERRVLTPGDASDPAWSPLIQ